MLSNSEFTKYLLEQKANESRSKFNDDSNPQVQFENERLDFYTKLESHGNRQANHIKLKNNIKKTLLSEALYLVVENATPKGYYHERTDLMKRNLVNKFIEEAGVNSLLGDFETKSYVLSEMSRVLNKYFNIILESNKTVENSDAFTIDMDDKKNFFDELNTSDMTAMSDTIRHRVTLSLDEFVTSNMQTKAEIKEILNTAKSQVDMAKDSLKEEYELMGKSKVSNVRQNKKQNILEAMIYNIASSSMTKPALKEIYYNESGLDMDLIVGDCTITYTFLETLNSAKLKKIDAEYLQETLNSLK